MKKVLSFMIVLLLAVVLVFANGEQESRRSGEPGGSTESTVERGADAAPLMVTDCFGREVEIPEHVERIACLYAFTVHVITMLDRGDDIIAVVYGSKRDRLLNEINPHIQDAAVPSDSGIINIEELVKIDPDIVFLNSDTAMMDSEIAKLERFDLPYIIIDYKNIAEQMYAIDLIGEVVGRAEEAKRFNRFYREMVDFVTSRVQEIPPEKRIRVYHSVNEATRTDAPDTLPGEWTQLAGAINVSVGEPLRLYDNKYFASLEQIYLWEPEVIICNEAGVDRYMLTNEKWANLRAVQDGKVYQIPVGISRWGHPGGMETPLAMVWTAKLLYPDLFHDVEMEKIMHDFYLTFFDFELSPEMTADVLSGRGMRLPKGTMREQEQ